MPETAVPQLATAALQHAAELGIELRGVNGPTATARAIAETAAAQTGRRVAEHMRMVVHELTSADDVPRPEGEARRATREDAPLVIEWQRAFTADVHAPMGADIDATITASIDAARIWLWIDGEPRSTASQQPAVGGIVRIGGVYTPPSIRGRGYARRLVHDISVAALRTPGVRGCTLNTDASNPVSNAIYRQIGYVPVAEHAQFALQRLTNAAPQTIAELRVVRSFRHGWPMKLDNKVAIVTGSGRGIGRAYARALAEAGASVVVNDIDADVAQETAQGIRDSGGSATVAVGPVGPTETAEALVERAVSEFGRLDIMCTNAGLLRDRVLWNMSDEEFDIVIETHLRGTFTCARAAVRRMREQEEGGRIVVVSSIAGQRGNFGQTNYSAAKAGIAAFARAWALECARNRITVNAIVPNAITRMIATIPGMAPLVEAAEQGQPLPDMVRKQMGMGTAEDVAPLLVFLASDAAADITGQCIGLGGDKLSLWAHPKERSVAFRDGGWTADGIAEVFSSSVGAELETYGIPFLGGKS